MVINHRPRRSACSPSMKRPSLPANESARLLALASYDILETEAEASFDAATELAATILSVPIALVSLVDVDRQWFKSRYGLTVAETSRDASFCAHVVAESSPLVVPDVLEDERFADNPLATGEPHVRFYAGMPLQTPDGFVLGSLCVLDREPRILTPQQTRILRLLAGQVVDQLEARRKSRLLAMAHARIEALVDTMVDGVVVHDRQGAVVAANRSAQSILGLTIDQIAGQAPLDPRWRAVREDGSELPAEEHPSRVALRTGMPCTNTVVGVHDASGGLSWLDVSSVPLRDDGEYAVITTYHDITAASAARTAEERLSRQEHLVTTGTLAAGVGHEINNPLSYVIGNLEYALKRSRALLEAAPSEGLRELVGALEEAEEGSERVRKIVRGLRAFAREQSELRLTDVGTAIQIAVDMAGHEIRYKAVLERRLTSTPPVLTDESRLAQVLVNLLVNAAQAFPSDDLERNCITLATSVDPDGRLSITVSDNGPGIPLDLQRRIFEPFFTTKPAGQGTGLGLAISQNIVASLGGELSLFSRPGEGATFRVRLPTATEGIPRG